MASREESRFSSAPAPATQQSSRAAIKRAIPSVPRCLQEALRFDCGHAAHSRCGHCLAVTAVLYIAGMENAGNVRGRAAVRDDVPLIIQLNLPRSEERRVGKECRS